MILEAGSASELKRRDAENTPKLNLTTDANKRHHPVKHDPDAPNVNRPQHFQKSRAATACRDVRATPHFYEQEAEVALSWITASLWQSRQTASKPKVAGFALNTWS